ncbi:MAG: hypothetical protein ABEH65_03295 [Halobacteriales archaeon]
MRGTEMQRAPLLETDEEIECPACERDLPINAEICPHCDSALR